LQRTESTSKPVDRILEAALQLFARHGFSGTSTREIADRAGVNQVTVFRHFPRKRELYSAALESRMQQLKLQSTVRELLASEDRPEIVLRSIANYLLTMADDDPDLVRLLHFSALELGSGPDRIFRKHISPLVCDLADYLRRSMQKGLIAQVDPYIAALAITGIAVSHYGFYQLLHVSDLVGSAAYEATSMYADILMTGLAVSADDRHVGSI
jgi:AcrR family transcriptional regulator